MTQRTKAWIGEHYDTMRGLYNQRNLNIGSWRRLVLLDRDFYFRAADGSTPPPAEDEERLVPATAHNIVDGYLRLLTTNHPVIDVPSSVVRKEHEVQVDQIEKMLWAIWRTARVYRELKDAVWHMLVDGWFVMRMFVEREFEDGVSPVVIEAVDPVRVYPWPSGHKGEWEWVMYATVMSQSEVEDKYTEMIGDNRTKTGKEWSGLRKYADTDQVEVVEYWDEDHYGVMARPAGSEWKRDVPDSISDGAWIVPMGEHGYGFLPWVIDFANAIPPRDTPEQYGVSVMFPVMDLLLYMARLLSQKATIIRRVAQAKLVTKTIDKEAPEINGDMMVLSTEEDAHYLQVPGLDSNLESMMDQVDLQVQHASLPNTFFGSYTVRMSGIAMELLRQPTLMSIAFMQEVIEEALEIVNTGILKLIEKFVDKKVYMAGRDPLGQPIDVVVDRSVINGYHINHVRLPSSLPSDAPATVNMMMSAAGSGLLSKRTARDVIQQALREIMPQSLVDEEEYILVEQILSDPRSPYFTAMANWLAETKGYLTALNQQKQPAGPVGGGQPGVVNLSPQAGVRPPTTPVLPPEASAEERARSIMASTIGRQLGGPPSGQPTVTLGNVGGQLE